VDHAKQVPAPSPALPSMPSQVHCRQLCAGRSLSYLRSGDAGVNNRQSLLEAARRCQIQCQHARKWLDRMISEQVPAIEIQRQMQHALRCRRAAEWVLFMARYRLDN
jgi:hypothetical protein